MKIQLFFALVFLFFRIGLYAEIKILSKLEKFRIINNRNNKIYQYHLLKPSETMKFQVNNIDSLEIYTRIILNKKNKTQYSYELIKPNSKKNIQKETQQSKQSHGINGEKISSYNKIKFKTSPNKANYKIINTSKYDLIIKIASSNNPEQLSKLTYISYSPINYSKEIILNISEKEYTYFSSNFEEKIEFLLEGPIYLKIISRLLYDRSNVDKRNYSYSVLDNDDLNSLKTISTYLSHKAKPISDVFESVSKGDVQVVRLGKGTHRIIIETSEDVLIFRLYISKRSIEVEQS